MLYRHIFNISYQYQMVKSSKNYGYCVVFDKLLIVDRVNIHLVHLENFKMNIIT